MTLKEGELEILEIESEEVEQEATKTTNDVTRYFLHKVGGFDLLQTRPVIIEKTQTLFVISNNNLRKYSLQDGSFHDEYNFGNKDKIVSAQVNEPNAEEIIVAIEDGTIIIWNHVENIRKSKLFLPTRLTYFRAVKDHFYFMKNSSLACCPKAQLDRTVLIDGFNPIKKALAVKDVAFGPKDKVKFVAIICENELSIYEVPPRYGARRRQHHVMKKTQLRCVDFHPSQPTVVTGDSLGRIHLWSNVNTEMVRTLLTWHSRAVADIAFSPSGTYIYSVGMEAVVVQWNIVGEHAGTPTFLPRLGAPIKWLAMDKSHNLLVTSHEDQCLQIIDTQLNGVRSVIEGLCRGQGKEGLLTAGLHFNHKLKALVLNGRVGHVQLYDPLRQKQLFQLDVTAQNVVSEVVIGTIAERVENEKKLVRKIFPIQVTKVALSEDGDWLATVEYRNDGQTLPEIRLKFWFLLPKGDKFFLNTNVLLPHQEEIVFINFSRGKNNSMHLVSGAKDKCFKIWNRLTDDSGRDYWNCTRSASFNSIAEPRCAAFSFDSSLLAVLFDVNTVTLWALGEQDSQTTLRYIPRLDVFKNLKLKSKKLNKIVYIGFGNAKSTQHLFIEVVDRVVQVSNILKQFEQVFTYNSEHQIIAVTQSCFDNVLALRSRFGVQFVSLETRTLLGKINLDAHAIALSDIVDSVFLPAYWMHKKSLSSPLNKSAYFLINAKCQIFQAIVLEDNAKMQENEKFHDDGDVIVVGDTSRTEIFTRNVNHNLLSVMLDKKIGDHSRDGELTISLKAPASTAASRKMLIEAFFKDVPAHVLPPVAMFERSFLKAYAQCLEDENRKKGETFEGEHQDQLENDKLKMKFDLDEDKNSDQLDNKKVANFLENIFCL